MNDGAEDEEVLQEMCASLLERLLVSSRDFERLWTNVVVEALERNQPGTRDIDCNPTRSCDRVRSEMEDEIDELSAVIEETTAIFEKSASLALMHADASTPNRDATAIFDCRRVVRRVIEGREEGRREERGGRGEESEKVLVALRRLTRLTKTLGTRLGSPYHVANSSVLASAVCEMGFEMEEAIDRINSINAKKLRKSLERMNERVIGGMKELLVATSRPTVISSSTTSMHRSISAPSSNKRVIPYGKSPTVPRKSGGGGYGSVKSPGFLMSTGMREARAKLPFVPVVESRYKEERKENKGNEKGEEKERLRKGGGRNTFLIRPDPSCRRGRELAALQHKWGRIMEGEEIFERSGK
ncbi:hypothetical protein PFISCL1PPCAC_9247, partial [Pristionchus fissidentatus]